MKFAEANQEGGPPMTKVHGLFPGTPILAAIAFGPKAEIVRLTWSPSYRQWLLVTGSVDAIEPGDLIPETSQPTADDRWMMITEVEARP